MLEGWPKLEVELEVTLDDEVVVPNVVEVLPKLNMFGEVGAVLNVKLDPVDGAEAEEVCRAVLELLSNVSFTFGLVSPSNLRLENHHGDHDGTNTDGFKTVSCA